MKRRPQSVQSVPAAQASPVDPPPSGRSHCCEVDRHAVDDGVHESVHHRAAVGSAAAAMAAARVAVRRRRRWRRRGRR